MVNVDKDLLYVELTLENVEVITIESKYIKEFQLLNYDDKLDNCYEGSEIYLELKKEANNDEGIRPLVKKLRLYGDLSMFRRLLKYPDIVNIECYYSDNTIDYFNVVWDGNEENKSQRTYIDEKTGNLCIIIQQMEIEE